MIEIAASLRMNEDDSSCEIGCFRKTIGVVALLKLSATKTT